MTIELPTDVRELYARIARAGLTRSFQLTFCEEPPDYIINDPQQIRRAEREWREYYAHDIALLAKVAQQALNYLEQRGHEAAVTSFTSSIITQPALNKFMHANVYIEELVAGTIGNVDAFRNLLTLFAQLAQSK